MPFDIVPDRFLILKSIKMYTIYTQNNEEERKIVRYLLENTSLSSLYIASVNRSS